MCLAINVCLFRTQAWYCCFAWDPSVPEVNRAANQEATFPAPCQGNRPRFQDGSAFPKCSYWRSAGMAPRYPTHKSWLMFQCVHLTLFSSYRKQVRHTWLDSLKTPTCVLFTQRGLPSCQKTFSWPDELEESVHKHLDFIILMGVGGWGWDWLGFLFFVNLDLLPACAPPNLSLVVTILPFFVSFGQFTFYPVLPYSL